MADNSVFITGAAEGAFVDALNGLPPWATEDTAENIERVLKKSLDIQTKTLSQLVKSSTGKGSGLDPDSVKKVNSELDKLIQNLTSENRHAPKQKKWWNDEELEHNKKKKRWKEEGLSIAGLSISFGSIIKIGDAIRTVLSDNIDTFNQLTNAGISVVSGFDTAANGFQALQQLSAITGVRFTELSKSMEKYSSAVNAFGVGKFAKTVGAVSGSLTKFGFSSKEAADLLGSYLESQKGYSEISNRTQEETQKDLIKFGSRIRSLSIATGMSTAKLLENLEAISQSVDANILSVQKGKEAADSTDLFFSSFKNKNLANEMLRLMTDTIKPLNNTFMNFQKTGFGGFAQRFTDFNKSLATVEDPDEKRRRLNEFVSLNKQEINMMIQDLAFKREVGIKEADGALTTLTALKQEAATYKFESAQDKKKREETQAAAKALENANERFKAQLQITFVPLISALNGLTWFLEKVNTGFDFIRKGLDSLGEVFVKLGLTKEKVDIASIIGVGVAAISLVASFSWLAGKIRSIFTGTLDIFSRKKSSSATGRSESRGNRSGRSGRQDNGPGLLEKLGKGIGEIGKGLGAGLGGLVGGFLKGLAEGLVALGNPKVLLGVVSLSGVAAAMWVAGKSFKEFSEISWGDVGKGLVAILGVGALGALAGAGAKFIVIGAIALGLLAASIWALGAALKGFPKDIFPDMSQMFEGFGDTVKNVLGTVGSVIKNIFGSIWNVVTGIYNGVTSFFGKITDAIAGIFTGIFSTAKSVFGGIYDFIAGIFTGIFSTAKSVFGGIYDFIAGIFTGIVSTITVAWEKIKSVFKSVGSFISKIFGKTKTDAQDSTTATKSYFEGLGGKIKSIFGGISNVMSTAFSSMKSVAASALDYVGEKFTWMKDTAKSAFDAVVATGLSVFSSLKNIISNALESAGPILTSLKDKLVSAYSGAKELISSAWKGVTNLFSGNAIDQLKELLKTTSGMQPLAENLGAISTGLNSISKLLDSFTGIDKLKEIVSTINGIDISKASAFGKLIPGLVSLPSPKPVSRSDILPSPKLSTIHSPSTISTNPKQENQPEQNKVAVEPSRPGIEKADGDSDINSLLSYQNSLLEQLLSETGSLVSVNRDILRYSRVNT